MIASDGARSSTISAQNRSVIARSPSSPLVSAGARRIVDRLASRAVAAGRVIDPAVPVRVLEIGRAGRDVGARDRGFAVPAQPLGQGRHVQGAAGRAAHPVAEIGLRRPSGRRARRPRRAPSYCRGGRAAPAGSRSRSRRRWPASSTGKTLRCAANQAPRSPSSSRNGVSSGPIRSARRLSQMTMTARLFRSSRDPVHGRDLRSVSTPFRAKSKISKLRSRARLRDRRAYSRRSSGCDSRNGTRLLAGAAMRAQPVAGQRRQIVLGLARADHRVAVAGHDQIGLAVAAAIRRRAAASSRVSTASMPGSARTACASVASGDGFLR